MANIESVNFATTEDMIREENRLLEVINRKAIKRKRIGARTKRINMLREFVKHMSPDNSDEEEDEDRRYQEAEEKMSTAFSNYNKKVQQHRGAIFKSQFAESDKRMLAKITTTINVEELQVYEHPEDRPNYRLICDVVGDNICLYIQKIQVADAQALLQASLENTTFLRETNNRTTQEEKPEEPQSSTSQQAEPQPEIQKQTERDSPIITPKTSNINNKPRTPRVILSPIVQQAEKQIKLLQEKLADAKEESIYKRIYSSESTSENDNEENDKNYIPKQKRSAKQKNVQTKESTRARGRPVKRKQPNQFSKKAEEKENIPIRQLPKIISNKKISDLVSAHILANAKRFAGEECATASSKREVGCKSPYFNINKRHLNPLLTDTGGVTTDNQPSADKGGKMQTKHGGQTGE